MNLSPAWVARFTQENWEAVHWSSVGEPTSPDRKILQWAYEKGYTVFTHDLDFGNLLAFCVHTPSVIQLRGQETSPAKVGDTVVGAIRRMEQELRQGALITIDAGRARARVLPLR